MKPTWSRRSNMVVPALQFWRPLAYCAAALLVTGRVAAATEPVDFVRDVRPILSQKCFQCHGPDKQESDLRLDSTKSLAAGGNSGPAFLIGRSAESVLVQAITGAGDVSKMPPEGEGLSADQISLVKRWIDEGAKLPDESAPQPVRRTSDHWSFQPLHAPAMPQVKQPGWVRNPIDVFIVARLEAAGLAPSPEADRPTLIRRLSLDLLGLPPSVAEVEAFESDTSADAYERLVDRLLSSVHYGERWGRHWLDLARYADSNGYTIDGGRSIWKYRDWVIAALNRDLPFDQFTIEQLAGDMLSDATPDQIIATGFHRNTLVNEEGGTDPEQFRVEAIVDRVSTTGAAFLGLTVGCARCHDHKYDPISQREFYQLFALFNNADEPSFAVPTDKQSKELPALVADIEQSEKRLAEVDANSGGRQAEWERQVAGKLSVSWTALDVRAKSKSGTEFSRLDDNSLLAGGKIPKDDVYTVTAAAPGQTITAVMLEALPHESLPKLGPGLADDGSFAINEISAQVKVADGGSRPIAFVEAHVTGTASADTLALAIDGSAKTSWVAALAKGSDKSLAVPQTVIFTLREPLTLASGETLTVTIDQRHKQPRRQLGRFRLSITAAPTEVARLPVAVRDVLIVPAAERSDAQRQVIREAYQLIDPERVPLAGRIVELKARQKQIASAVTTTLVMRERPEPRATHVHLRGDFLRPGAAVSPGVPSVLPPLATRGEQPDRLDFARWLVSTDNPLTPRVTVNRIWQTYFGAGLVATENDFGLQGDLPTHPELLDWLASQWRASGWSQKAMHRLIVTSATYRQSSRMRPELTAADPYNKLLGRQQRLRLEAETIRDETLAASGLLSDEVGGPGVYPPQPQGIYRFTQQVKFWGESQTEDRYRRGLYTYFWRSSPYPFLKTFDAPDATNACTRRARSNTPLQALTMTNDRAFFEIAQGFAASLLAEPVADDAARLRLAFRRCLVRDPEPAELAGLVEYMSAQRSHFTASPEAAQQVAPAKLPAGADVGEAATWTMVARVLFNLDEFITRE